jgi:hypothetical protein
LLYGSRIRAIEQIEELEHRLNVDSSGVKSGIIRTMPIRWNTVG